MEWRRSVCSPCGSGKMLGAGKSSDLISPVTSAPMHLRRIALSGRLPRTILGRPGAIIGTAKAARAGSVGTLGTLGMAGTLGTPESLLALDAPGAGAGAASGGKKGGKGGNKGNAGSAGNAGNAGGATAGAGGAATAGNNAGGGTATELHDIHPSVIQTTDDGQNPPVAGQTAADLSKNNFANACALTPKVRLPMVSKSPADPAIPSPLAKFPPSPTCRLEISEPEEPRHYRLRRHLQHRPQDQKHPARHLHQRPEDVFCQPTEAQRSGQIIGHTHVVMETIDSLTTTKLSDPTKFFFFKGVNDAQDAQGNVNVPVAGGVKPGVYRMCTIVSSATHQPAIVPIAQHGSLDDCIYFTATPGGATAPAAATAATAKTAKGAQPAKNSKGATTSKAKSGKGKGGK
ncbi:hypothetical protein B0H13DRAFT_2512158 [Mycena leptocephala]|nr:hypothetical protein B0H13DRAFT_2512158 [Mycena leptocephala]